MTDLKTVVPRQQGGVGCQAGLHSGTAGARGPQEDVAWWTQSKARCSQKGLASQHPQVKASTLYSENPC